MTCIVGLCAEGDVYIGGDSAAVSDSQHEVIARSDPKVFRVGEFIFGCSGSFRMMNILHYFFDPPEHPLGARAEDYMCIGVADHLRELFRSHGWSQIDAGAERGGQFMIGYAGHLFYVGSDYQIGEFGVGYYSLGMGMHYALGSLFSTSDPELGISPKDRVIAALAAAEEFSPGVKSPFLVMNLNGKNSTKIELKKYEFLETV